MSTGCLSDIGYMTGETIRSGAAGTAALIGEVAAGSIALYDAIQLVKNYDDQRAIAQREINITREQQNQVENVFWPREDQFLTEFSVPEPLEAVEVLGARYAGRLVALVAAEFASQLREIRCAFKRYTTSGNEKQIQDLMLMRSSLIANARVFGRSIGFAEYQARNDVNIGRRKQAVELGRGLMSEAMTLLSAASHGVAAVGDQLGSNLGGALRNFGLNEQMRSNSKMQNSFFSKLGRTDVNSNMMDVDQSDPVRRGDKSRISDPIRNQSRFAPQNAEHHTSAGIGVGPAFANAGDLFIPPSGALAGVGVGATVVEGVINLAGALPIGGGPASIA